MLWISSPEILNSCAMQIVIINKWNYKADTKWKIMLWLKLVRMMLTLNSFAKWTCGSSVFVLGIVVVVIVVMIGYFCARVVKIKSCKDFLYFLIDYNNGTEFQNVIFSTGLFSI